MNGHGSKQKRQRPPLVREQHRPSSLGGGKRIPSSNEGMRSRRHPTDKPGKDRGPNPENRHTPW